MIGKMNDLINAANGSFKPRTIPTASATPPSGISPYQQAMDRRRELAITSAQRQSLPGYTPPGLSQPLTGTFENLLSGYRPSSAGLSSKGKYGGFMTAADRDAAIGGAAMELASGAPEKLRGLAGQRYTDLEKIYRPLTSKVYQPELQSVSQAGGLNPRRFEEISQLRTQETKANPYGRKLAEWYAGNIKPAEEYLATAQQLEATPVSDLATAIASRAYGMNPQLARGKFGGLDKTLFEEQRNRESFQQTGMGYEEAQFRQQQALASAKAGAKQQIAQIEASTGMNIGQLRDASGMNDQAIYSALSKPGVILTDWNVQGPQQMQAADVVGTALQIFNDGDQNQFNDLIDNIRQTQGQEDIASLIQAIVGLQARKANRNLGWLEDYYLNQGQ